MPPLITTVVFDVGWVLVHLDYEPLLSYLAMSGQRYGMKEVIASIDLEAHERGELSGDALLDNLLKLAPQADPGKLKACWVEMFAPVASMVTLARQLSTTHRVYLLSNVGELHWAQLKQQCELHLLGHGALTSFEAKVMKPHPNIYEMAERRFDLKPANTVFIDDLEPNILAAKSCGWHAIQHTAPETTIRALNRLGVDC